jgi:uncharacterized protein
MQQLESIADGLVTHVRSYGRCVVSFSGGVDSALVAKVAQLALAEKATAITAVSASLARGELVEAKSIAQQIGIRHEIIRTDEFSNPDYVRNAADRCYHCKTELYDQLELIRKRFPDAVIANGTNTDDTQDFRPGLRAASEHQVRSPLAECGIDKKTVRELAAYWELPVWNKPAMPCLSSRVAYGEEVTPERLRMIDSAEQFLRERGFSELRVRFHRGDLARVEVPIAELPRLMTEPLRSDVIDHLETLGFRFVTVDMHGFRSGNLNTLIPAEILQASAPSQNL